MKKAVFIFWLLLVNILLFGNDTRSTDRADTKKDAAAKVDFYPNTFSKMLSIESNVDMHKVCIRSASGRLLMQMDTDTNQIMLDVNQVKKGSYIVEIELENGEKVQKRIIKQKYR